MKVVCYATVAKTGDPVSDGCAADTDCAAGNPGTIGICSPSVDFCGGNATCTAPQVSHQDNCGGIDCGAACGSPGSPGPNGCVTTSPETPIIIAPVGGVELSAIGGTATVPLSWNATTVWGRECLGNERGYTVCVGTNATDPCLSGGTLSPVTNNNLVPPTTYSVAATPGAKYWEVQSANKSNFLSTKSTVGNFCIEGGPYYGAWSVCNTTTHKRTRTCTEDCGVDDCSATPVTEDCIGAIRGTLFDASDMGMCPAFSADTGYAIGLDPGMGIANRAFGLSDYVAGGTHPWSLLTSPAATDANGNYSINAYAPGQYKYDFSSLSDKYYLAGGPKFTCISNTATVDSNDITCNTQPCTLLNGMNFGFWRIYTGWWQVVGGNVHGEKGITSVIPSSLTNTAEMALILPDKTQATKRGILSYNTLTPYMLGTNPNAKVSESLWQVQSKYTGNPVYDWAFYNVRFNSYVKTAWDGTNGSINYTSLNDYEIFKTNDSVISFDFSPTGIQKAIFHVNGDINITSNLIVPDGAFLAIIAKGTITFDPSVTRADGWFVGGRIAIPCTDVDGVAGCDKTDAQFKGNGAFVSWGNIDMARDMGIANNTTPAEQFSYRQDMYDNAPLPMKAYQRLYLPYIP